MKKELPWLDEGIKNIISLFKYNVYHVSIDRTKDCVCKDFLTKQAKPDCKMCLGTGYKIKIYEIEAASQESSSSFRSQGNDEKGLATVYYIDSKFHVAESDLVVDQDQVVILHRIERKKGTNRDYVYQKCLAINKKTDVKVFLKNFYEIIKG